MGTLISVVPIDFLSLVWGVLGYIFKVFSLVELQSSSYIFEYRSYEKSNVFSNIKQNHLQYH
jgi:hypothetical protein